MTKAERGLKSAYLAEKKKRQALERKYLGAAKLLTETIFALVRSHGRVITCWRGEDGTPIEYSSLSVSFSDNIVAEEITPFIHFGEVSGLGDVYEGGGIAEAWGLPFPNFLVDGAKPIRSISLVGDPEITNHSISDFWVAKDASALLEAKTWESNPHYLMLGGCLDSIQKFQTFNEMWEHIDAIGTPKWIDGINQEASLHSALFNVRASGMWGREGILRKGRLYLYALRDHGFSPIDLLPQNLQKHPDWAWWIEAWKDCATSVGIA